MKKRKIKQMRRFINQHGFIKTEYKKPKDDYYRKGSYFADFNSEKLSMSCSIGDINKYYVYKEIVKEIKDRLAKL